MSDTESTRFDIPPDPPYPTGRPPHNGPGITQAERSDAAKILGVHPNTVLSWLERDILKSLDPTEIEALRRVIYGEAS